MYSAELHGKLSLRLQGVEDILTSNVFSFLKYCNRKIFLRKYLEMLGYEVSAADALRSEFIFWPRFDDKTEPDVIIRVGGHYILFEAKYHSKFGDGDARTRAQLVREIEGGIMEASSCEERFSLIAITADYCYKPYIFASIPPEYRPLSRWTNWQQIAVLIQSILESPNTLTPSEREFAADLYDLLCKKNLRAYGGIGAIESVPYQPKMVSSVFFDAATAGFRGDFIGFCASLASGDKLAVQSTPLFFEGQARTFFEIADMKETLKASGPFIFLRSNINGE